MPKSSADYIIRKAAESSLLGLSQTLNRSPLAEEIEARGYNWNKYVNRNNPNETIDR